MIRVVVVMLSGNYASTSLVPLEVFHAAGRLPEELRGEEPDPPFSVVSASLDGLPVETPYGVRMHADTDIASAGDADLVVVPAAGINLDAQFTRHAALFPWLHRQHQRGAFVAGVCSGVAYLAEAGLLDGHRATTHWALAGLYAERFPKVTWQPEAMVTEDRRLLCCGGVYAAKDLALYLVEKFCGREAALSCAKALILDMPRTHQSGYAVLPLTRPHEDPRIRAVEAYLAKHFAEAHPVAELASRANMSARTFMRRFKAATGRLPGEYVQALRMRIACEMLEGGAIPVQAVGAAVGYTDAAHFRALFKRHTGTTPAAYRSRFTGAFAA